MNQGKFSSGQEIMEKGDAKLLCLGFERFCSVEFQKFIQFYVVFARHINFYVHFFNSGVNGASYSAEVTDHRGSNKVACPDAHMQFGSSLSRNLTADNPIDKHVSRLLQYYVFSMFSAYACILLECIASVVFQCNLFQVFDDSFFLTNCYCHQNQCAINFVDHSYLRFYCCRI